VTEVLFIGTGEAFGSGGRRNSAILVRGGGKSMLLDCGPATLNELKKLGIDPREIDGVVVSHFHGDHVAGLPFLLLDDLYENPRREPLIVLGPPGIEQRVWQMCAAFSYPGKSERRYNVRFDELSLERERIAAGFRVRAYPAHHQPETRPHMVNVACNGKAVFYTGDTGWHEALPECVSDSDLFISECTLYNPEFEYHLSHAQLDRNRDRFRCGRIILTHLGSEVLRHLEKVQFDTAEDGLLLRL
jgi:ribonuclease BN (tRNA processing enzyme)